MTYSKARTGLRGWTPTMSWSASSRFCSGRSQRVVHSGSAMLDALVTVVVSHRSSVYRMLSLSTNSRILSPVSNSSPTDQTVARRSARSIVQKNPVLRSARKVMESEAATRISECPMLAPPMELTSASSDSRMSRAVRRLSRSWIMTPAAS